MKVGIHLPQYGRVAGAGAITRAAQHAEDVGFAHVWVSDHILHPASQSYPSPRLYDPMVTLVWAAAVTERIGLGTSVLVVPQHNPLELANQLASLDSLSGGRLTVAVGVGWSEAEYEALGYDFRTRGARLDEAIDLWRTVWEQQPASFHGRFTAFDDVLVLPPPAHRIPIWVGGGSEASCRRAVAKGDGFHLIGVTPDQARPTIERLRRDRPDASFTVSLRTGWDPQGMESEQILAERDAYEAAGVSVVVAAPWRTDLDEWIRSTDLLAELVLEP